MPLSAGLLRQAHQPGGVKGLSLPLVRAPPNDLVILARGSATTHIRAAVCSGVSMQGFSDLGVGGRGGTSRQRRPDRHQPEILAEIAEHDLT
jgi:hypothetical protein